MSLFQCEKCGCVENTATSAQGFSRVHLWNWVGREHLEGMQICSACGPSEFSDKKPWCPRWGKGGVWHNEFDRVFLPKGEWETNPNGGGLIHKETRETDYYPHAIRIIYVDGSEDSTMHKADSVIDYTVTINYDVLE